MAPCHLMTTVAKNAVGEEEEVTAVVDVGEEEVTAVVDVGVTAVVAVVTVADVTTDYQLIMDRKKPGGNSLRAFNF